MSSTLPASAETKMIDLWMMIHVLILAFVFILQLALHHVFLYEQNRPIKIFPKKVETNKVI